MSIILPKSWDESTLQMFHSIDPETGVISTFIRSADDNTSMFNQIKNRIGTTIESEAIDLIITNSEELTKQELDDLLNDAIVKTNNLNVIKLLIEAGANPRNSNDQPFINSSTKTNPEMLTYFITEHNAKINAQNDQAFVFACYRDNYLVAKILIDNGFKINHTNEAIIINQICNMKSSKIIPLVIELGVNPNKIFSMMISTLIATSSGTDQLVAKSTVEFVKSLDLYDIDYKKAIGEIKVLTGDDVGSPCAVQ
jgi:hypothetical protein